MASVTPRLAVLAALRQELRPFLRLTGLARAGTEPHAGWRGRVGRVEVVAGVTSMGVDAARHATEALLRTYRIDHVIGIGIAGGVGDALAVGELLVPEVVVDGERGTELRPDRICVHPPAGKLLTSDALVRDKSRIPDLVAEGFVAVDMESAAIGTVCEVHGVRWSVLRAISDRAGDPVIDDKLVGLIRPDGTPDLRALVWFVCTRPARVPHVAALGRGMALAAHRSAAAAVRACATY